MVKMDIFYAIFNGKMPHFTIVCILHYLDKLNTKCVCLFVDMDSLCWMWELGTNVFLKQFVERPNILQIWTGEKKKSYIKSHKIDFLKVFNIKILGYEGI